MIVALAPTLAGRIYYEPALPALRDQLDPARAAGFGDQVRGRVYDKPFWRGQGLNGQSYSDRQPVHFTFDNSPPSGRPGVLLGSSPASATPAGSARVSATDRPARVRVLSCFELLFGKAAARPRMVIEHNWSEEVWTRGCYAGYMPPGVWSDFGSALRAPAGRIHWAGTETAEVFNGYMDGAVRSGERAAREVGAGCSDPLTRRQPVVNGYSWMRGRCLGPGLGTAG